MSLRAQTIAGIAILILVTGIVFLMLGDAGVSTGVYLPESTLTPTPTVTPSPTPVPEASADNWTENPDQPGTYSYSANPEISAFLGYQITTLTDLIQGGFGVEPPADDSPAPLLDALQTIRTELETQIADAELIMPPDGIEGPEMELVGPIPVAFLRFNFLLQAGQDGQLAPGQIILGLIDRPDDQVAFVQYQIQGEPDPAVERDFRAWIVANADLLLGTEEAEATEEPEVEATEEVGAEATEEAEVTEEPEVEATEEAGAEATEEPEAEVTEEPEVEATEEPEAQAEPTEEATEAMEPTEAVEATEEPEAQAAPTEEAVETAITGDAENGGALFIAACSACHAAEDGIGPALTGMSERAATRVEGLSAQEYLHQSIVEPGAYVVEGYDDGIMPTTYAEQYTEQEITDLVAYILEEGVEPEATEAAGPESAAPATDEKWLELGPGQFVYAPDPNAARIIHVAGSLDELAAMIGAEPPAEDAETPLADLLLFVRSAVEDQIAQLGAEVADDGLEGPATTEIDDVSLTYLRFQVQPQTTASGETLSGQDLFMGLIDLGDGHIRMLQYQYAFAEEADPAVYEDFQTWLADNIHTLATISEDEAAALEGSDSNAGTE
jgi:mono/diheme cytochrome c family protein